MKGNVMIRRKFFTLLLATLFINSMSMSVHASAANHEAVDKLDSTKYVSFEAFLETFGVWEVSETRGTTPYLFNATTGYRIDSAWTYDEDGKLIEIDLVAHAIELNYSNILNAELLYSTGFTVPIMPINDLHQPNYRFHQSSSSTPLGIAVPASAEFRGPVTIQHTLGVSTSHSFSAGVNATWQREGAVQAGASFNWTRTSTSQEITSGSWQIASGRIGRVYFTPRYNQTNGRLWVYYRNVRMHDRGSQWGRSPRLVGQFTDGVFEIRTRVG